MHFALPPRKTSFPPPYARVSAKQTLEQRRKQLQYVAYLVLTILTICLVLGFFKSPDGGPRQGPIDAASSVLIVTILDESKMGNEYMSMVKRNRDDYAARHGYKTFYTNISTYAHLTQPSPPSWALVPALRHALTQHPEIDYIWSLDANALIMNPSLSLHHHVFSNLTNLMLKDIPVVPPDSVIHTFSHLQPSQVCLILTQDADNVAHTSFILRNTAAIPVAHDRPIDYWSHYFLDAWFDPLYRAYAFQKAENHALEHIIQWHPTILAKLAVIDQKRINSYTFSAQTRQDQTVGNENRNRQHSKWESGDLVVNLKGCEVRDRGCNEEMKQYFRIWQDEVAKIGQTRAS